MYCREEKMRWVCELLDGWAEAGGTVLDCAHNYGDGAAERAVGRWLRTRGNRDHVVILTKGAHPDDSGSRVNAEAIDQDLAESLNRLETDRVEIYLLHRDDESVPVGEIVDALDVQVRSGKILSVGASNWTCRRIEAANTYADSHGRARLTVSSPHMSLARQTEPPWPGCVSAAGRQDRAYYAEQDILVMPWSSQAGGFFVASNQMAQRARHVYDTAANRERLRRCCRLAASRGVTANQIALAWVLGQPFPVVPVIGALAVPEISDSVAALDIWLTSAELAWLDLQTDAGAASEESE